MKTISIILLIISTSCCSSSVEKMPVLKYPVERCGIFLKKLEGETYTGKCRCHNYEITEKFIGRISKSVDHPLSYCKNHVVFNPASAWVKLRTWLEELFFWNNQIREN